MRIAILSNMIPPSPYGQSILLYRLLNDVSPDEYYLITDEAPITSTIASAALPAKTYRLGRPPRRQWSSAWDMVQRAFRRVQGRSGQMENYIHLRARQISEIIQRDPCCALVAGTGDLVSLPAAAIACAENGIAFVPYIFDDYGYNLVGWERTIALRHARRIMTQAKKVIVLSEPNAEEYKRRYNTSNAVVIHTPVVIQDLNSIQSDTPILDKRTFNIVFTGAIYHAHYDACHNLIQAIETLPQNTVKFHIFTDQSAETLAANGVSGECVQFHAHVHQSVVASALREANLLFLPLAFNSPIQEILRLASPTKMGDYLAVARPILVHAPADTYICQYVRQHECGIVVDQPDVTLLAEKLTDLIAGKIDAERLAQRARQRAEIDFAVERVQARFFELMQEVCQPSS